jgi:macrolide-specific efflux system membrane fusion protein
MGNIHFQRRLPVTRHRQRTDGPGPAHTVVIPEEPRPAPGANPAIPRIAQLPADVDVNRTLVGYAPHRAQPPQAQQLEPPLPSTMPEPDSATKPATRSATKSATKSAAKSPPSSKRRRRAGRVLVGALLVVALGVVVARRRGGGASPGLPQTTAQVTRGPLTVKILETGKVEAVQQAQIRSRVGGVVIDVPVKEGQVVRAGDVLLRLDPADYEREIERVRADIEEKEATVSLAVSRKRNSLQGYRLGVVPRVELEGVNNDLTLARARLKAALVALRTARDQVRHTTVTAPFAGQIIARNVHPGEVVTAGMTATVEGRSLLVLAKTDDLSVRADLNQIDFARVRLGQRARITLDLLPGKEFVGHVVARAASSTPGAGGGEVLPTEIRLDRTPELAAVTPGMTADVEIEVSHRDSVLLVPIEAVATQGDGGKAVMVWSQAQQRFETRKVETGDYDDRQIEITAGLVEGARIQIGVPVAGGAGG